MYLYFVSFISNGNHAGNMYVKEDMTFSQLTNNFCLYYGLKEDNKPTFFFNSREIEFESTKTLKELGILPKAVIQVKTEKPLNIPESKVNNDGNIPNS